MRDLLTKGPEWGPWYFWQPSLQRDDQELSTFKERIKSDGSVRVTRVGGIPEKSLPAPRIPANNAC